MLCTARTATRPEQCCRAGARRWVADRLRAARCFTESIALPYPEQDDEPCSVALHKELEQTPTDHTVDECVVSTTVDATEDLEQAFMQNDLMLDGLSKLCKTIVAIETERPPPEAATKFHSKTVPTICVDAYLRRLHSYLQCSDACFVMGLVYVERLAKLRSVSVCRFSVHRLLATSVVVAAKFHDDVYYSNAFYAKVSGISLTQMNALEVAFLKCIEWKLNVSPQQYREAHNKLLALAA